MYGRFTMWAAQDMSEGAGGLWKTMEAAAHKAQNSLLDQTL